MCEEIHPILTFACVCVNTTYSPPNIKSGTVIRIFVKSFKDIKRRYTFERLVNELKRLQLVL